ncbi:hypothetical protein [Paenibacillus lignilyticus]|uniref:Uncharacterized protein n=1 Tax=Paenibacillus lignilyticus TaxID=1172615 RepID=A0ABS5C7R2_9BACL|nr:hypothetical protein [Paenibacillus lignilyticus]MBP3962027.1 hypothetical protein [Paenibacillus lignilyticus]
MKGYRYFFPVLFTFELNGRLEVHHYTTDGTNIDSSFPDQSTNLSSSSNTTIPATNLDYSYVGYKKSTEAPPSGGTITATNPPTIVYDATYDTYYLNLYYTKKSEGQGQAIIKHYSTEGQSLDSVFHDRTDTLTKNSNYTPAHPTATGFNFAGYKKTTGGTAPDLNPPFTSGDYSISPFLGNFDTLHLYYFYDVVSAGKIHVRHMVRNGPTGAYALQGEAELIPITTLPHSRAIGANSDYGIVQGRNTSYVAFSNTVTSGTSVGVSLTAALPEAFVSFFYEKPIVRPPGDNRPPEFKIGFVDPSNRKVPLNKVVEGKTLDLIYIDDPSVPTPNDPDGDLLTFMGFDYDAGDAFVQSIPSKSVEYLDGQHGLPMDSLGYHFVCGQMRDDYGETTKACTYIEVVPRNPIPVIECPPFVIANHPLAAGAINSTGSNSPMGRAINHARDEWTNKQTSYTNPTASDITITVSLHVYDSEGLKSQSPATCTIIVKPDLPPIAKLIVPPLSVRGTQLDIVNKSTSQDGDAITATAYKYKYDANNNGFSDEAWMESTGTMAKMQLTPTKVGKYLFYLKVTEEYGAWDDTLSDAQSTVMLDVVNNAPEVSFEMEGNNPQPDLDPYTRLNLTDMLNWPIYVPGTNTLVNNKKNLWRAEGADLVSGEGRNFGNQKADTYVYDVTRFSTRMLRWDAYPLQDNGYGSNELSPWRSTLKSNVVANLLDEKNNMLSWYNYEFPTIRSSKKLIYFDHHNTTYYYDYDRQIGTYTYDDRIYALDPSKLSNINDVIDNGSVKQKYASGQHPYQFILKADKSRTADVVYNDVPYKDVTLSLSQLADYEMSDGYLFVKRYWKGYVGGKTRDFYDIGVYDAQTGEERYSSFDFPEFKQALSDSGIYNVPSIQIISSEGRNLLVANHSDSYAGYSATLKIGESYQSMYYLSPDFKLTKIPSTFIMPAPHSQYYKDRYASATEAEKKQWGYGFLEEMRDATGAIYRYEALTYSGSVYELNVTKYNADYSLAWRRYIGDTLSGSNLGITNAKSFSSAYYYPEIKGGFFFNPTKKELYAKVYYDHVAEGNVWPNTYEAVYVLNSGTGTLKKLVDAQAGDDLTLYHYGDFGYSGSMTQFSTDFGGNIIPKGRQSFTIDGYRTSNSLGDGSTCDDYPLYYTRFGTNTVYDATGNPVGSIQKGCNYSDAEYGEYVGDGVYLSLSQAVPNYDGNSNAGTMRMTVSVGTPTTNPAVIRSFTNGQFYSPTSQSDTEYKFTFKMDDVDYDQEWLGFSFRMQDRQNGYALETDANKVELAMYKNGVRTVLRSQNYSLLSRKSYAVKLQASGEHIAVFLDNTPLFEVDDATYSSGRYGYFSNKAYTTFGTLAYKPIATNDVWSDQYAIWDEGEAKAQVQYNNIQFTDPENDPAAGGLYDWTVQHTPRFIQHQGASVLNNKTFHNAQLTFDKVGDYLVRLKAKDDPNPSYLYPDHTFDSYRKSSNEFTQKITVHRRPIANYALAVASTDGKVIWTDKSYDPDRYLSSTDYSTEATGIDYKTTKGVMEKKFYYISPSGIYTAAKLVSPLEIGTYEVGMAVRDEYDAWSEWTIVALPISKPASPNSPPNPGFTSSHINTFRGVAVNFDSYASDAEDGDRTELLHEYYLKNVTTGSAETLVSGSRTNWNKSFSSLGTFMIRQLVEDTAGAAAQFSLQVNILNQLPSANVANPTSSDQNTPTKLEDLRPNLTWTYFDADSDGQTQFQMKIYRYGGILVQDSGVIPSSGVIWTPSSNLPEKVNLYVMVRVFDGYDWSTYSSPKYFYIETNKPPTGDFDWQPKPVFEGDSMTLTLVIADPDKDHLDVQYTITDPAGVSQTYNYNGDHPYSTVGPSVSGVLPGVYTIQLTVADGKAPPIIVRKSITVLPLSVSGQVKHTELWEERRKASNRETSGNENSPRAYSVYWAGEKFMLSATTTATGTATIADQVKVTMNGMTVTLSPTNAAKTSWTGEMWEESFEELGDGPLTFTFKAFYNNGTVKTANATITIAGDVQQTIGVHRVQ